MMLGLSLPPRNQQAHARENRIPGPSPIERRTVAQSPAERFSFSIFSPHSTSRSPPVPRPYVPLHHTRSSPRLPRLIFDHRSSFVRGVMGVPLLSGRGHACKKTGKKSSSLVLSARSLYLSSARFLLLFSIGRTFRTRPRLAVHAITSTCAHNRTCPP